MQIRSLIAGWLLLGVAAVSSGADAAPVQSGAAMLTPQNTKIQFVCAHAGPRPDPSIRFSVNSD